jgi:hypothetical protein
MDEEVVTSPEAHHVIGKSQNLPVHIPQFMQNNRGNPAVKVLYAPPSYQMIQSH